MKILPSELDVVLYEEGFEDPDLLNRAEIGKYLSTLIERTEDPMVIALNAGWGMGKTYFLKRWVGAHALDNGGRAIPVYFDAFANDYLSDPLPGLVAALSERFPQDDASTIQRIKAAAFTFAKPLGRMGLAMAGFGATAVLPTVGDAAVEALRDEAASALDRYWTQENGRRAAIEEFRSALTELVAVEENEGEEPTRGGARLVFVVDELDRCRPDYALEVLEVIKHFFAIPGIAFILGVNLKALENSVKARYGPDIDASAYLRKFINVSLELPAEVGSDYNVKETVLVYLEHQLNEMGIPHHIGNPLRQHVKIVARNNSISIRDIGKILSGVTLLGGDVLQNDRQLSGWRDVMIALLVAKVIRPEIYEKLLSLSCTEGDLETYFDAPFERRALRINDERNEGCDRDTSFQFHLWLYLIKGGQLHNDEDGWKSHIDGSFSGWSGGPDDPRSIPKRVQREWLEPFKAEFS